MRRMSVFLALVAIAVVASAAPGLAKKSNSINNGPLPDGCVKFEDDALGVEGVVAEIDGVVVTLSGWVDKGEAGEFVGFDVTAVGGTVAVLSVKSGRNIVPGLAPTWIDPDFASGDKAHAISNVVVCVVPDPDPPIGEMPIITE